MRSLSVSSLALALTLGLASLAGMSQAQAADFSINPTRITLDAKKSVDTLTLVSNEDREISFEVSLMKWTQKAGGEWVEVPSKDLVVYPALMKMPVKGKGLVRVGAKSKAVIQTEGTYRLILQELPGGPAPEGTAVRLLTRVSLPVFLQPASPTTDISLQAERVGNGAKLTVFNRGNVRLDPQNTKVEFVDAAGKVIGKASDAKPGPAYVLAGASSTWDQSWGTNSCGSVSSVKVILEGNKTTLTAPLTGSCK